MLQKTVVFLILGLAAAQVRERFANPDVFGGSTYAVQQYSNSGPCYLITLGKVGGLNEYIRRTRHFSNNVDCTKLGLHEYTLNNGGTELGEYWRTQVDSKSIQQYRNGNVCARDRNKRHGADLQLYYKADEWTNPPSIRVTPRRERVGDQMRDDPCFDEIILYVPQGSTWTSKYVGAKETCRQLANYEYRTIGWAEWVCERHPRCSGVYNPGCDSEVFRLCDKFHDFSAQADTSKHCLYRQPVAQQCKWGDRVKGSIKSANVHRYTGMTISECKAKCEANDLCKSIDFKQRSGGRGDCNLGNCRIGEGCTNDDDAEWVHYSCPKASKTCHNNRLTSKVEIRGHDIELNKLDASWNMTKADSLKVFFPECEWDQDQVKTHHWKMKNCKCGGAPCNQCGYAELCSEICSQAKACKYVTYQGNRCEPKSSSNDRRTVSHHSSVSGPPAPMCFVWTKPGVEQVTKDGKAGQYDQPEENKPVSAKVQEIFFKNKYMETALKGNMIKKVGCAIEGQITNRAALVQPLWVAFVAVPCAVMQ